MPSTAHVHDPTNNGRAKRPDKFVLHPGVSSACSRRLPVRRSFFTLQRRLRFDDDTTQLVQLSHKPTEKRTSEDAGRADGDERSLKRGSTQPRSRFRFGVWTPPVWPLPAACTTHPTVLVVLCCTFISIPTGRMEETVNIRQNSGTAARSVNGPARGCVLSDVSASPEARQYGAGTILTSRLVISVSSPP